MPTDIKQCQIDFLAALGKMEARDDDGRRRIDGDDTFLDGCVVEAKAPLKAILDERVKVLQICKDGKDGKNAEWWRQVVLERCRNDILYWINNWAFILNPHITKYGFPMKLPFVLFPKQEEYIKWKEGRYKRNLGGLVFKCRDVGVSWLNVVDQAWHWFFEPGFQGRFGSLKAEEVDDKNDPDSLFQKLRVVIYNTPQWMRPVEFWKIDNKFDTLMKIYNPITQGTVAGQQGDNMGRGGRASMYDVDEWAKVAHDKMVDSNLANNSPCVFYTGTPMGRDNDYAEKLTSGKIAVFEFNWYDDPRKTEDWLANFKENHSKAVVEQEVLKNLDAFTYGTAIPSDWVSAAVTLWERIKNGQEDYVSQERVGGLDVAAGGSNRSVLLIRNGIVVEECFEWDIGNTTKLAEKAGTVSEEKQLQTLLFDPIGVGMGVKGALEVTTHSFRPLSVDVRRGASEVPLEGDTRPARDRCADRRSELMERVRRRFENTYEYIVQKTPHNIESMIAIPPEFPKLRSQLSLPERFSEHGKIRLETKESMVRRGVESPDYFDATLIAFADETTQMRVVKSFDPKHKDIVLDKNVPVISLVCDEQNQNYISIYHQKNLIGAVIGATWGGLSKTLTVYEEHQSYNPMVSEMVSAIQSKFPTGKVYEYVGNKEMFNKDEDDLFMQYMEYGILVCENTQYNELSAVALLNQMIERNQIRILSRCKRLLAQLDGFVRQKGGGPDKSGMEVAMALCTLLNRLKEFQVIAEKKSVDQHYRRKDGGPSKEVFGNYGWMRPLGG